MFHVFQPLFSVPHTILSLLLKLQGKTLFRRNALATQNEVLSKCRHLRVQFGPAYGRPLW